jgi:hypothetical protein
MPAPRADEQGRHIVVQSVFAPVRTRELDPALDRIDQVRVAADHVQPGRRVRILEVGHEAAGTRVQGVDDHLPIDGPRDLDAPVAEVVWRRLDLPVSLPHLARLRQEVERPASIELVLPC